MDSPRTLRQVECVTAQLHGLQLLHGASRTPLSPLPLHENLRPALLPAPSSKASDDSIVPPSSPLPCDSLSRLHSSRQKRKIASSAWLRHASENALTESSFDAFERDACSEDEEPRSLQQHVRQLATPHKSPTRGRPTPAHTGGKSADNSAVACNGRLSIGSEDCASEDEPGGVSFFSPYKPPQAPMMSALGEPNPKRRPPHPARPRKMMLAESVSFCSSESCNPLAAGLPSIDCDAEEGEDEEILTPRTQFVRTEPTDQLHSLRLPSVLARGMNNVTPGTVADLLKGVYAEHYDRVLVLDCRFKYEYDGGHVRTAVHVPTDEDLHSLLQSNPPQEGGERVCVVFHCEFSSQRGPNLYRALRSWDRAVHADCYPQLYYPELYLLEGGYKRFFQEQIAFCDPPAYQPMWDSKFKCEMRDGLGTIKKKGTQNRSKSMNDITGYNNLRKSLKW